MVRTLISCKLKKSQPVEGEVSREFRQGMLDIEKSIASLKGEESFAAVVRGAIRADVQDWSEAQNLLKRARSSSPRHPIERYFRFELAQKIARHGAKVDVAALTEAYRAMWTAPELSEETQIYYAFNWLKSLAEIEANVSTRDTLIEKMMHDSKGQVVSLFQSEASTLKIVSLKTIPEQDKAFKDLNEIMNKMRGDYYLRKAIYVRAILNLTAAANFKYLSVIASNWLRDTSKSDTELAYAREIYLDANLDQAYGYWGAGNLKMANGFFYGAAQGTDDPESHYGYITTALAMGQRKTLDIQYAQSQKIHLIEENIKYVNALLGVIEGDAKDEKSVTAVDEAIKSLESMTEGRDNATRYLLLGYCYMEKLRRTASGAEFDSDAFENAHRDLMLAYDLGRDNVRVRISALMNLGIVHEQVLNHALAARFFSLRAKLPFENQTERNQFDYLYARALDRSRQPDLALKALANVPVALLTPAMLERQGYEAALAGRFETACEYYAKLLEHPESVQGNENNAKIHMMYGYSLLRANRKASAVLNLQTAIEALKKIKKIPRDENHIVELDPARLVMIANGFLAQAALNPKLEREALSERIRVLESHAKEIDGSTDSLIQAHVQMADAWSGTNLAQTKSELDAALKLASGSGDGGAQYLSRAVFRTLVSYLSEAAVHPELFSAKDSVVSGLYPRVIKSYEDQEAKAPQEQLAYQGAKLELLWASYATKILHQPALAPHDLDSIMMSSAVQQLRSAPGAAAVSSKGLAGSGASSPASTPDAGAPPNQWQELNDLALALRR